MTRRQKMVVCVFAVQFQLICSTFTSMATEEASTASAASDEVGLRCLPRLPCPRRRWWRCCCCRLRYRCRCPCRLKSTPHSASRLPRSIPIPPSYPAAAFAQIHRRRVTTARKRRSRAPKRKPRSPCN